MNINDLENLTIQTFDDSAKITGKIRKGLVNIFGYNPERIQRLNNLGAGIFLSVNPQENLARREIANTVRLAMVALDCDVAKVEEGLSEDNLRAKKEALYERLIKFPLPPSGIIETKHGFQPWWMFTDPLDLPNAKAREKGNELYRGLVAGFTWATGITSEGDSICRVVRFPGYFHQKDPQAEKFEIVERYSEGKPTTLEEFKKCYPPVELAPSTDAKKLCVETNDITTLPVQKVLEKLSGTQWVNGEKYAFRPNPNGTVQILINGKPSGQWIDSAQNTIGGPGSGMGNPTVVQWLAWYLAGRNNPKGNKEAHREAYLLLEKLLQIGQFEVSKDDTKKAKKEKKVIYALDVDGVVDVLDGGGRLVYLTNDGKIVESIEYQGELYEPPPKESISYLLPDKNIVLRDISDWSDSSDGVLYTHLLNYHREISDLPHEFFYDLLVLWDFHTYFLDRLHFSPILYLYAVKERGKSRTGKGCIYVSRRGVFTETVREPDIIRWGHDHKACLGFDVKDFPRKIQRANCDDLLLSRFEKGSISSRTLWPEKGAFRDTKNFKIFGATIVMTNRPVDDILESRSISIGMKPSFKKFNKPVLPEDALELKAQLVAFRFKHQNTELVNVEKPADGRLGDILSPLNTLVLTFFPERRERFNELLEIIIVQREEEATDTFEAQVVEIIIGAEKQVTESFLSIDLITSLFNEGKNERFAVKPETIGRVLKGLGFSSKRVARGKRGIYYDPELVKNIAYQYGLGMSKTPSFPSLQTDFGEEDVNNASF